jgi:hypothetical protein
LTVDASTHGSLFSPALVQYGRANPHFADWAIQGELIWTDGTGWSPHAG